MRKDPLRAACASVAAGAVLLLVGASGWAQDQPPAVTPGGEAPVLLVCKFKAGQEQAFLATVNSKLTITREGQPADAPPLPVNASMTFRTVEKVTEVKPGSGTLTTSLISMLERVQIMGRETVLRIGGGQASGTQDGKPISAAAVAKLKAAGGVKRVVHRDTRGRDTPESKDKSDQIFPPEIIALPEKPVSVGDTWEVTAHVRPHLVAVPGGKSIPEAEVRFTYTLKRFETGAGHRLAVIETSGRSAVSETAEASQPEQVYTGTTRLDLERGVFTSAESTARYALRLSPADIGLDAGAPDSPKLRLEGLVEGKFSEVPAAAPRAPAKGAKPPARKAATKK